ncbi:MAG: Na+-driven multidrug efflux pump, partial [Maribacter sp.]
MANVSSEQLGSEPIGKLLIKQAVPASIGILVMSLNILVDSIFVGNWIGSIAIAAINVVLPVSFFIGALGMAIGIGGSSIVSRALGANNYTKAVATFGNQVTLTVLVTVGMAALGLYFVDDLIPAFGGKGAIFEPAKIYYTIVLYGIPFLGLCMMGNTVIRAEGKPKFAMIAMIIPSVGNLVMDYIFIYVFDWGMAGAAWATTIGYVL